MVKGTQKPSASAIASLSCLPDPRPSPGKPASPFLVFLDDGDKKTSEDAIPPSLQQVASRFVRKSARKKFTRVQCPPSVEPSLLSLLFFC